MKRRSFLKQIASALGLTALASKSIGQMIPFGFWRRRGSGSLFPRFMTVTNDFSWYSYLATSTSGTSWSLQTLPTPKAIRPAYMAGWASKGSTMAFFDTGGGNFSYELVLSTTDGVTWTQAALPQSPVTTGWGNGFYSNMAANSSTFVVGNSFNYVATSADAVNWTVSATTFAPGLITTANNVFFAYDGAGDGILYRSTDGINWTPITLVRSTSWSNVAWNGSVYCTMTTDGTEMLSGDGINWTQPSTQILANGMTANGSVFCAVGSTATAISSSNGMSWTSSTLPTSSVWEAITNNGTIFCAVGKNSEGATSPDGTTWTSRTLPGNRSWYGVAWNGSVFCAVAYNTTYAATSTNGTTWTLRTLPISAKWTSIAWNGSVFAAFAFGSNVAASSPNGSVWSSSTLPTTISGTTYLPNFQDVASLGSLFCVVAGGGAQAVAGNIATSTNGLNWTMGTMVNTGSSPQAIASNGSIFCAVGVNSFICTSSDAVNWTQQSCPVSAIKWTSIAWNGTCFAAASAYGPAMSSGDGINWTLSAGTPVGIANLVSANNNFLAYTAGTSAAASTSPDGISWSNTTLPAVPPSPLYSTGSTYWFFVLSLPFGNHAYYSTNGSTWSSMTLSPGNTCNSLTWNGSMFCAVDGGGSSSNYLTSASGLSWTLGTFPALQTPMYANDVAYNGSLYAAVGRYGYGFAYSKNVLTTADLTSWTTACTFATGTPLTSIAALGSIFVAVGNDAGNADNNTVLYSPDGTIWSLYNNLPFTQTWSSITSGNSIFVASANGIQQQSLPSSVLAVSSTGLGWSPVTLPHSDYWQQVIWNGTVFCIVGGSYSGTSSNGTTWTLSAVTVPLSHVAWNGSSFCALGVLVSAVSVDGLNWTYYTQPSMNPTALTAHGSLFMCTAAPQNVWVSNDGITWTNYGAVDPNPNSNYWLSLK